jgi:predicted nicotinamide N-methyase
MGAAAFDTVRCHTVVASPTLCPEIRMHLITPACRLWRASEEEARAVGLIEPYWAFCWAGGQALTRYVLDHGDLVRGRRVLAFGAGGGAEAIAAALRGADVLAADIDPLAAAAVEANAALNDVRVATTTEDLVGSLGHWDVILAGDVTYEPDLTARVLSWLRGAAAGGVRILLGDPGRGYVDPPSLETCVTYDAPADNDPGESFFVRTTVYRVR